MLVKTEAIVLHALKYGETRLIVDLFTRQSGRLSLVAALPKTPRGRLKKQYFQPMTLVEVTYEQRPNAQLQPMKDARLLSAWTSIPFSPEKLALTLFTAEFLYHALRSEQQDEPMFAYIADAVQWLDTAAQGYANFHLTFLMHLSRFLGFYPNLDSYHAGDVFDLRAASFSGSVPVHRDFLPADEARRIHLLMRMDFPTMHLYRLSRHDRNRVLSVLLDYYRIHLPGFPELRSQQVLRELWDE
ncbi:MAG: DNA repair protein RecO [Prevotella sp.]|nr:DNA repair protein RecO [Prevotella sp.]